MLSSFIQIEKLGCIGIITLNNPPQNIIPFPVFTDIKIIQELASAEDIKGIVIAGAGRHFSAGADTAQLFSTALDELKLCKEMENGYAILRAITALPVPVAAAIQGACWGGGLEIALSAHIRIASNKALFAFPEVNHNLMPGWGGIAKTAANLSIADGLSLYLSGNIISAEEALKQKLIDEVVSLHVIEYTIAYLNRLVADRPKKVVENITKAIHNARELPIKDAVQEETKLFCELAYAEAKRKSTI